SLVELQAVRQGGTGTRATTQPTAATTGPFQWGDDTITTAPDPEFAVYLTQANSVDPAFQQFFTQHNGAVLLGNALTPGYATEGGWIQIFTYGALVKPSGRPGDT